MKELSKGQIKFIKSLHQKKYRIKEGLFICEGKKIVDELISSQWDIKMIVRKKSFEASHQTTINQNNTYYCTETEFQAISNNKNPQGILAVVKIPEQNINISEINNSLLTIALDDVRDPGNLGTIIRTADWFGINNVICSENCAEIYNPKVIQTSMGSFLRVKVTYADLKDFLDQTNLNATVYGAFMDGEDVYNAVIKTPAILILGNEANGITNNLQSSIRQKITIPRFGRNQRAESLNVAISAGIFCSEFLKKQ